MRSRTRDPDALAYLRLVALGAVIGIPAALLAAVFLALVHDLEHWLWTDLPSGLGHSSPPWYLVIGLPVVGACVVVVARRFFPGDGGHGRRSARRLGGIRRDPGRGTGRFRRMAEDAGARPALDGPKARPLVS